MFGMFVAIACDLRGLECSIQGIWICPVPSLRFVEGNFCRRPRAYVLTIVYYCDQSIKLARPLPGRVKRFRGENKASVLNAERTSEKEVTKIGCSERKAASELACFGIADGRRGGPDSRVRARKVWKTWTHAFEHRWQDINRSSRRAACGMS